MNSAKNNFSIKFFFLVVCAAFVFSFCSRTEPVIEYGFISLVYYMENNNIKERLSFFIIAQDADGIENLDELYLYHDYEQLLWLLKSTDWMSHVQNEKTWIGSWSLALEGEESFPRGQYRAVLVNKGGERTKRYFSFDAPLESRFPFPALEINDGMYTVDSLYPDNRLLFYDSAGLFIAVKELQSLSGSVTSLGIPSNARSVALWAEDPNYFTSALTEVKSLR